MFVPPIRLLSFILPLFIHSKGIYCIPAKFQALLVCILSEDTTVSKETSLFTGNDLLGRWTKPEKTIQKH